jgi:tetratricopeptide (TPR) repeat protein
MTVAGYHELLTHGHNALIQMMVEGGLVGLAGMFVVAGAIGVAALRRERRNTTALAGLTIFAVACMTDNPSVFPFLVVPAIVWAALASPREELRVTSTTRWIRWTTLGLAAAAGLAAVAAIGGAWFYERAAAAAQRGDATAVIAALRTATSLDPEYPLYQRDLGVWLLSEGRVVEARDRLEHARKANPGDPAAHRAAALAAAEAGDTNALSIARRALELRDDDAANLLTVAYIAQKQGDSVAAREALQLALRYEPWMAATDTWGVEFDRDVGPILAAASQSWQPVVQSDPEHHQAQAWLAAMVGEPVQAADVNRPDAAAAETIWCRPEDALERLGPGSGATMSGSWLLTRILIARVGGDPVDDFVALAGLRRPIVAFLATHDVAGASPFTALAHDAQFYGRRAIKPPDSLPVFPSAESGLSAWLRDPVAAADRGAPDSGLAACR